MSRSNQIGPFAIIDRQEVTGSNPVSPTTDKNSGFCAFPVAVVGIGIFTMGTRDVLVVA